MGRDDEQHRNQDSYYDGRKFCKNIVQKADRAPEFVVPELCQVDSRQYPGWNPDKAGKSD